MKRVFPFLVLVSMLLPGVSKAQLEKVIVETYYVSDSLDATDTTDLRSLPKGSKTYRVYVDLKPGCKLVGIYSNSLHPLKISSTSNFFNNIDRPTEYFGYLINKQYFGGNPLLSLDSWLTLGLAEKNHLGILKPQDTDGSILNQTGTWGGSSGVVGGLLKNNDPLAGIPIVTADGFLPNTATYTSWSSYGFINTLNGSDTTCFGDSIGSSFISTVAELKQSAVEGVAGANPDSNQVLIAQLTTLGTISFNLNLQIKDSTGNVIYYVSDPNVNTATPDTIMSPWLVYPPSCGCTDPQYMEYDPSFACSNASACITLKKYGCTDTMACNFDPTANMLLPNFCCYPGYCQDRDIGVVCAGIHPRQMKQEIASGVYPNPVDNFLSLQMMSASSDYKEVSYQIMDAFDRVVEEKQIGFVPANTYLHIDATQLPPGLYLLKLKADASSTIKKFIKN